MPGFPDINPASAEHDPTSEHIKVMMRYTLNDMKVEDTIVVTG